MKMLLAILSLSLVSSLASAGALSNQEILGLCKRGPNAKIWVDRPTTGFFGYLRSLGYDKLEATGIAYRICRDKDLSAGFTDRDLVSKSSEKNVDRYIDNIRKVLNNILSTCRPGAGCSGHSFNMPLEGLSNQNSICGPGSMLKLGSMPMCLRGPTHKVWIDRPTLEFVNYFIQKGYGKFKALGAAYKICRDVNLTFNPQAIPGAINQILSGCKPKGRCNLSVNIPLEGYPNDYADIRSCRN